MSLYYSNLSISSLINHINTWYLSDPHKACPKQAIYSHMDVWLFSWHFIK